MNKQELLSWLRFNKFPEQIIKAFSKVRREEFVPEEYKDEAYEDNALPIGYGATISQPYTIAFMLNLLALKKDKNQKILEIGSGSGYVLALISEITGAKIYGAEIIPQLVKKSRQTLKNLGYKKIKIINKSGKNGLLEYVPYDRIIVSAAANIIPLNLANQLKPDGILVAPVLNSIIKIKKSNSKLIKEEFHGFAFVPLQD